MAYLRIWNEIDIKEIQDHIIIANDQYGYCPGCKKIGFKIDGIEECPQCGREFRYVTSADSAGGKSGVIKHIKKKLPDLIFVDYNDYEQQAGKKKAEDLFSI